MKKVDPVALARGATNAIILSVLLWALILWAGWLLK